MTDINKRLAKWNTDIKRIERAATESKEMALRRRDGIGRRVLLWGARVQKSLAALGRRWRDEDMSG